MGTNSTCDLLVTASETLRDCDYPAIGGTKDYVILIKKSTLTTSILAGNFVVNGTYKNRITEFTVDVASLCIDTCLNQVKPKVDIIQKANGMLFKQSISFQLVSNLGATYLNLAAIADGEWIAIFENSWKGEDGKGKYKVFGIDGGLRVAPGTVFDPTSDTEGVISITLESQDNSLENYPDYSIECTTEKDSDTLIALLLIPA